MHNFYIPPLLYISTGLACSLSWLRALLPFAWKPELPHTCFVMSATECVLCSFYRGTLVSYFINNLCALHYTENSCCARERTTSTTGSWKCDFFRFRLFHEKTQRVYISCMRKDELQTQNNNVLWYGKVSLTVKRKVGRLSRGSSTHTWDVCSHLHEFPLIWQGKSRAQT